jgi:hypothetical protein
MRVAWRSGDEAVVVFVLAVVGGGGGDDSDGWWWVLLFGADVGVVAVRLEVERVRRMRNDDRDDERRDDTLA